MRVSFVAGASGDWSIDAIRAISGTGLGTAARLARIEAGPGDRDSAAWVLEGVRSYDRYVTAEEKARLAASSPELGRADARCATLIPIRKREEWWALAQDERRAIFEERSRHIAIGARYLPAIARRLYHCRDLGGPWDFLTWFEYAEADRGAFDELVGKLRETEEWQYVAREVEIRVRRE